jgi:hypothetical protein
VVAKGRERLAVKKQRSQRLHMERLNLKKLSEVEGKEGKEGKQRPPLSSSGQNSSLQIQKSGFDSRNYRNF